MGDSLVGDVLKALISTTGITSVLLFLALVWQTRELERERRWRREDATEQEKARIIESERRVEAFDEMGKAVNKAESVLTRMSEQISQLLDRRNHR